MTFPVNFLEVGFSVNSKPAAIRTGKLPAPLSILVPTSSYFHSPALGLPRGVLCDDSHLRVAPGTQRLAIYRPPVAAAPAALSRQAPLVCRPRAARAPAGPFRTLLRI